MTPQEAKAQYGATHYVTMKDGVTPELYYKVCAVGTKSGPVKSLQYLTFTYSWHGSFRDLNDPLLIPIDQ